MSNVITHHTSIIIQVFFEAHLSSFFRNSFLSFTYIFLNVLQGHYVHKCILYNMIQLVTDIKNCMYCVCR